MAAPARKAQIYAVPSQLTVQPGSEFTFTQRVKVEHAHINAVEADLNYPVTNYWVQSDPTGSPFDAALDRGGLGQTQLLEGVSGMTGVQGDLLLANTTFRARCHPGTYRIGYEDSTAAATVDDHQDILTKATGPRITVGPLDPSKLCIEQGYRAQSSTTKVVFYGSGFSTASTIAFGAPGVSASVSRIVSTNELIARVVVAAGAGLGDTGATVTNLGGGSVSCADCFTVTTAPSISSVDPAAIPRGSSAPSVYVSGQPFSGGTTVRVSGHGVAVEPVRGTFSFVQVSVTIGAHVKKGPRDVMVVNPDGGTVTCSGCLTVT